MNLTVKEAIKIIEDRFERTCAPSKYVDGFRTTKGLELAVELNRMGIYIWTEPMEGHSSTLKCSPKKVYARSEPRNSNLNLKRSPRLTEDSRAWYWFFETTAELKELLNVYATLRPGELSKRPPQLMRNGS